LSKEEIKLKLKSFNLELPKSTDSFLNTYFSTSVAEYGEEKFEFQHKSFQEYFLAEYIIESIINKKIL
jgi:predicted NACHT family NTPase